MFIKIGNNFLKYLMILVLVLNIFLFARIMGYIYLPGELTPLEKAKQGAQAVINYSEELAKSYGVDKQKTIIDILARFKYEVEKAANVEEVASLMLDYGRQTQDVIFREAQNQKLQTILKYINEQELPEKGKLTISSLDGELKILDPDGIISPETKAKIQDLALNQTIEIVIEDKRASIVTTGDIFNQVDFLQTEIASLERQLKVIEQKAGYAAITGMGVIVEVYDNTELESTGIIHSTDIRNIIDELLIAGARGIEVGGQRLTVNSAIRCVGPTIMVNNKPIPVNPVIIKAVGDPDTLASSLEIIKKQLASFGIKIVIEKQKELTIEGISSFEG